MTSMLLHIIFTPPLRPKIQSDPGLILILERQYQKRECLVIAWWFWRSWLSYCSMVSLDMISLHVLCTFLLFQKLYR